MIDIVHEIEAVRARSRRRPARRRTRAGPSASSGPTTPPIEDVWDALTRPERIGRWFLPISGDYRIGGRYQFEGNAGGEILELRPPERASGDVGLRGAGQPGRRVGGRDPADGRRTGDDPRLVHTASVPAEMWDQFGPGAVGVGWEMGMLGLTLHLSGGSVGDPIAWQVSDEGREFATRSSVAWGAANAAAGADPETVAANIANTTAFYTTVPDAPV